MYTHHNDDYILEKMIDICTGEDAIIFLVQEYKLLCRELLVCRDDITDTIVNFMALCNRYSMYIASA